MTNREYQKIMKARLTEAGVKFEPNRVKFGDQSEIVDDANEAIITGIRLVYEGSDDCHALSNILSGFDHRIGY